MHSLGECKKTDSLIAIHRNPDCPEMFLTGYVSSFTDVILCLQVVDSLGYMIGGEFIRIRDIERFHVDTEYLRTLRALNKNLGELFRPTGTKTTHRTHRSIVACLGRSASNEDVITIRDKSGNMIHGLVKLLSGRSIHLQQVDISGKENGQIVILLSQIASVTAGCPEDKARAFARNMNYSLSFL